MATTTPTYSWPVPTSTDYVADGAVAIEALGDAIDTTLSTALGGAYPGLRLVKKQTIGSGVSYVEISNAFSATYDNYKIIINGGVGSTNLDLKMSFPGISTGYYTNLQFGAFNSAAWNTANDINSGFYNWMGTATTGMIYAEIDIQNPFLNKPKMVRAIYNTNFVNVGQSYGANSSTTSVTNVAFTPNTGNITGGTIYVYGYGKS